LHGTPDGASLAASLSYPKTTTRNACVTLSNWKTPTARTHRRRAVVLSSSARIDLGSSPE
jgi:hypothetical protein